MINYYISKIVNFCIRLFSFIKQNDKHINNYTLKPSFSFYKGSIPMSQISSITFTNIRPDIYDECWFANIADTNDIVGYRCENKVVIVGDRIYANDRCSHMFSGKNSYGDELWSNLSEIRGLEVVDTSYVTNMNRMFADLDTCVEINGISKWNVSSVKNMSMMFSGCTNLVSLDIGDWDVGKVTNFSAMFQGHDHMGDMKLEHLYLKHWNTSSAKTFSHMFYGCGVLKELDIGDWDVSKVTNFSHMFTDCYSLEHIDVSHWSVESATSLDAMFNDCRSLVRINVSGFNTKVCRQFSQMFERCSSLEKIIGIEHWDVSNADTYAFSEMFYGCENLTELDLSSWSCPKVDNTDRMFKGCSKLKHLDLSGFNTNSIKTMIEMFDGCDDLIIKGDLERFMKGQSTDEVKEE